MRGAVFGLLLGLTVVPLRCLAGDTQNEVMWQFYMNVSAEAWATLNADPLTNQGKISLNLSVRLGSKEMASNNAAEMSLHGQSSRTMPKLSYRVELKPKMILSGFFGGSEPEKVSTGLTAAMHRDWGSPCHICTGTGLKGCFICTGTGLAAATSAPGLGSPLPHLSRWITLSSRPRGSTRSSCGSS